MTEAPDTQPRPAEIPTAPPSRRANRIVTLIMAAIVLGGIAFVANMKSKAKQVEVQKAVVEQTRKVERSTLDAEIVKSLAQHFGGESADATQRALVGKVGNAIATKNAETLGKLVLKFHLLAEPDSINLFVLPSTGEVYVTTALLNRMQTEGQLAAALAHGAAHVVSGSGLESAPQPDAAGRPAWQHTVDDERNADVLAFTLMSQAGYDPNAMVGMFGILSQAYEAGADVAFFATHPNDEHRMERLTQAIAALYPQGIPPELSK